MSVLQITSTDADGAAVVALEGELDLCSAPRLAAEIDRLLGDPGAEVVVLDLRRLRFMDSTGLRFVLRADDEARRAGRKLALIEGPEPVRRVFEITGMRRRLDFVSSLEAAFGDPA